MSTRLEIRKTYKLFIGGAFVRSESGRCLAVKSAAGARLDNVCQASRKDLREAVSAARRGFGSWASKTAFLRGQILYRAAEMLQGRRDELSQELVRCTGADLPQAQAEVETSIDRLVYFAGWTDKYAQVFGGVNPVASPHLNVTLPEPSGVVAVVAPEEPALVALVSLLAAVLASGNSAVVLASERFPLPAATFSEILATSDLPPGVVNILTGRRAELLPPLASHMDVNTILDGTGEAAVAGPLQAGTASNLKRYATHALSGAEWLSPRGEDPYWILDGVEFKTFWHPLGA